MLVEGAAVIAGSEPDIVSCDGRIQRHLDPAEGRAADQKIALAGPDLDDLRALQEVVAFGRVDQPADDSAGVANAVVREHGGIDAGLTVEEIVTGVAAEDVVAAAAEQLVAAVAAVEVVRRAVAEGMIVTAAPVKA